MRIGMPSASPSMYSKLPTTNAARYEDILGVVAKRTVCRSPGPGVSEETLEFEIATWPLSATVVMSKVALYAGSSNDGKARRASVDSNCEAAYLRHWSSLPR